MNEFDKTFLYAFYNSFLKIKLHFDKENAKGNMLILNPCSFQIHAVSLNMCSDLVIDKMCS